MGLRNFLFIILLSHSSAWAQFAEVSGLKYPNSPDEGLFPVSSTAIAVDDLSALSGFTELLPYVTPSPHQENSGTCLYMSLTGAAEWWLHRLNDVRQFTPDGDLNLSPRWWISMAKYPKFTRPIYDWYSDTILMFNETKAALNRDYRFTKDWHVENKPNIRPAHPDEDDSAYGTRFNWIDLSSQVTGPTIKLPEFQRQILYAGSKNNPWSIGTAPVTIVDQVKESLRTTKAPVQVVYNHLGFWHSVIIVGYDDHATIGECPFIKQSLTHFDKGFPQIQNSEITDSQNSPTMQTSSTTYKKYKADILKSLMRTNGCSQSGVFYVRDSIYSGSPTDPIYRYDLKNPQGDRPYSKKIILREYDWLTHLSNHVTVITVKNEESTK